MRGGPGESGGRNSEGDLRGGNIVDQTVIEEPIGVFPGNHSAASVPGEFSRERKTLLLYLLFVIVIFLGNKQGLFEMRGFACLHD